MHTCIHLTIHYAGKYHHYDTIVYPKNKYFSQAFKKSWTDRAKGFISGFFGFNKGKDGELPDSFTPLDHQEANTTCLYNYLQPYQEMLCSGVFVDGHNVGSVADEIAHIWESLSFDQICPANAHTQPKADCKRLDKKEFLEVILGTGV